MLANINITAIFFKLKLNLLLNLSDKYSYKVPKKNIVSAGAMNKVNAKNCRIEFPVKAKLLCENVLIIEFKVNALKLIVKLGMKKLNTLKRTGIINEAVNMKNK